MVNTFVLAIFWYNLYMLLNGCDIVRHYYQKEVFVQDVYCVCFFSLGKATNLRVFFLLLVAINTRFLAQASISLEVLPPLLSIRCTSIWRRNFTRKKEQQFHDNIVDD
jgi:hypothetical protein